MHINFYCNFTAKQFSKYFIPFLFILIVAVLFTYPVTAQPSGGPYGPVQKIYEISGVSGKIYYAAPDGKADAAGESIDDPTTIETAVKRVNSGDAIILRGGTYRTGNLILNQGITIQPYKDEQPILKGTFEASEWENPGNGLWIAKWEHFFPSKPDSWWRRNREGKKTPLYRFNNDMVFVNGKFLQTAGWEGEVDENTFYIDYDNKLVYIGTDPKDKLVEITAFNVAILRTTGEVNGKKSDGKGYTIKGITFTQYAYRALEIEGKDPEGLSPESEHGKEVTGTTLENCEISFCSRVAGYLRGDKMTIRNCKVSDTSTEGIYILGSSDVLLEKNIFMRNNIEQITGYYPAAVKIFNQCYRVTCRDNLVTELPWSNGIWYDVGNVDGVFINNWVEDVGSVQDPVNYDQPWPSQNGFFFEISKGAICAGNVFVNCDHGTWALNSSNVKFYNNTYINSMAVIARNGRSAEGDHFGWHPRTGPGLKERAGHEFVNNILYADKDFDRPLFFVQQPDSTCKDVTGPQLERTDNNIYVRSSRENKSPLIIWSPADADNCRQFFSDPAELHKLYSKFETGSRLYTGYNRPVFKSVMLNNFELLPDFHPAETGDVPDSILQLIGNNNYIGAYPAVER
jgi:parallel beta-helix repeat protein